MRELRTYVRFYTTLLTLLLLLVPCISAEPLSLNDAPELLAGRKRGFEQNVGQLDPRVSLLLEGPTYHAFVQPDSVVFTWFKRVDVEHKGLQEKPRWHRDATIRMTLDGADPAALVEGLGEGEVRKSYLSTKYADPAGLRPLQFDKVAARSVYNGIDVEYYLRGQQLEHDFVVSPGADPSLIRLSFDGIDSLELTPAGDLLLVAGEHTLVQQAPFVYQGSLSSPEKVSASYELGENNSVTYVIGDYDRSRTLVIDPIDWTTYAGGNGVEFPLDVAAGLFGDAYLLMLSTSTDLPLTEEGEVIQKGNSPGSKARIAKILQDFPANIRRVLEVVVNDIPGDNAHKLKVLEGRCSIEEEDDDDDNFRKGVASTNDVRVAIVGGAQGLTSTDGTMAGERLDAFIALFNFGAPTSNGPLLALFEQLSLAASPGSDQFTGLELSRGCKDSVTWAFAIGTASGEVYLPGEPANPHQGSLDTIRVAYRFDHFNPTVGLTYSDHIFTGTDELDVVTAVALQERSADLCDVFAVTRRTGSSTSEDLNIATFQTTSGQFQDETRQTALGDYTTKVIRLRGNDIEWAGRTTDSNIFVKTGTITQSKILTNIRTATFGDSSVNNLFGLVSHPTEPGGDLTAVWSSRACDENSFFDPPDPADLTRWGEPGPENEDCVIATKVSPGSNGQKAGSQLQITGNTLLGPGGGSAFDSPPDGSYVIAGFTGTDVFGAIDGVEPPAAIRDLSPTGPGDVFAIGGVLNSPWVITLTGSASFVREPAARGGIITGFSPSFAAEGQSAVATEVPLPNNSLGTVATLTDSAGQVWPLGQFFLNTNQLNGYIPAEVAQGLARVEVQAADGSLKIGEILIVDTQPNAFTFGPGIGIALTIHIAADGTRTDTDTIATPTIAVGPGERLIFSQFVTGTAAAQTFQVFCDGEEMALLGAAPSAGLLGVEQVAFEVDVPLLGGTGTVQFSCEFEADGVLSNPFNIQYDRM